MVSDALRAVIRQVPVVEYDSVVPDTEQPIAVPSIAVKDMAPVPDPPDADNVIVSPKFAIFDEVMVTVDWEARAKVTGVSVEETEW